jgi:hypothetical protein
MPARRSDSRQNVIRQLNSLLTKHVVAAGNSNKDAGSTPAASTSLRRRAATGKAAAPKLLRGGPIEELLGGYGSAYHALE